MPNATIDFILNILAGSLEAAYEPKFITVLQKLHDTNPDAYKAALFGFNAGIKAVQPIVAGTPTHLDDGLVQALAEAVQTSAQANGVDLNAA